MPLKDAEDFNQTLKNNRYVLSRLQQILKEELEIVEKEDASVAEFDNPNWVYRQAARVGEKHRLRKTLDLLEFLD
jgi:hypothetical protein